MDVELEEEKMREDGGSGIVANDRLLAAWEIASVIVSVLIAEWIVLTFAGNKLFLAVPIALAFALMFLSHIARGESAREIGWRFDNFGEAARLLALPMSAAAIVIVIIGWMLKGLRFEREQILGWLAWLPIWGLTQQYALQGFINRRAQILYGRGWRSILLVAFIFTLLHLPNPWLSVATFAGGLLWAYVYQRAPNLPALALSHALMSMILALSLPADTLNSLRVGIKYFG
ncbi:MAG TPA: CPBP family intramembrane glutamic endopeptidase [Pyrinomonadaceae bacterium]|nr:CPBP family intramembrane glutamic endopeptidase [Pyrinomonadaceae bacterium]